MQASMLASRNAGAATTQDNGIARQGAIVACFAGSGAPTAASAATPEEFSVTMAPQSAATVAYSDEPPRSEHAGRATTTAAASGFDESPLHPPRLTRTPATPERLRPRAGGFERI